MHDPFTVNTRDAQTNEKDELTGCSEEESDKTIIIIGVTARSLFKGRNGRERVIS